MNFIITCLYIERGQYLERSYYSQSDVCEFILIYFCLDGFSLIALFSDV